MVQRNLCGMRLAGLLAAWTVVLASCTSSAGDDDSSGRILGAREYSRLTHDVPYVFRLCKGEVALTYVGVRHTRSARDETVTSIQLEFERLRPTVALLEGPVPAALDGLDASVSRYGEAGAVAYLARSNGIEPQSLDMPFADEVAKTKEEFGTDSMMTFYGLRLIAQERRRNPNLDVAAFITRTLLPWLARNRLSTVDLSDGDFRRIARSSSGVENPVADAKPDWFNPLIESTVGNFASIARRIAGRPQI